MLYKQAQQFIIKAKKNSNGSIFVMKGMAMSEGIKKWLNRLARKDFFFSFPLKRKEASQYYFNNTLNIVQENVIFFLCPEQLWGLGLQIFLAEVSCAKGRRNYKKFRNNSSVNFFRRILIIPFINSILSILILKSKFSDEVFLLNKF